MAEFTYGSGDPLMQLYGDPQFQDIRGLGSSKESVDVTGGAGLGGYSGASAGPITDDQIRNAVQQIFHAQQSHTNSLAYRRGLLETPTIDPALKGPYEGANTWDQTWINNYQTVLRALSGDPAAVADAQRILAEDIANHQSALTGGHEAPARTSYYSALFNDVNDIIGRRTPGTPPFTIPAPSPDTLTPSPETATGTSVWNTTPPPSPPRFSPPSTPSTPANVPSATSVPVRGIAEVTGALTRAFDARRSLPLDMPPQYYASMVLSGNAPWAALGPTQQAAAMGWAQPLGLAGRMR